MLHDLRILRQAADKASARLTAKENDMAVDASTPLDGKQR
jgi:hypothetical protein